MGFNFKKKYGQNFLKDNKVITDIVDSLDAGCNDVIIEIGPGAGALTRKLVNKGAFLVAYEIDTDVSEYLSSFEHDKVNIIYDDFLKRDILSDLNNLHYQNLFIVGNLPYYITTPIITKIIEANINPTEMIFMVQKEVANRFSAKKSTREYGAITVMLNYFFDINRLFLVSRSKFYPIPNVDSAVVKFVKKQQVLEVDINRFNEFVKVAFHFKRKNLRNNFNGYDLDRINAILAKHGLSLNNRAEDLDYRVFVDIANNY